MKPARVASLAALLGVALPASVALAVEPVMVPTAGKPAEGTTSHKLMFGIRLDGGDGWEFAVPYMDSPPGWCAGGDTCSARSAIFGDLELTFAPTGAIEVVAGIRYEFEKNGNGEHDIVFRPGIIAYLDESSLVKVFLIFQGLLEVTGELNVGFAPGFGVQFDFHRYVGMYIQVQANFMFLEVVRFAVDGSLGIQGRIGK
ncbi:MAG TPA: hypothetical protein VG389_12555 [Myxococcota bacterium]|nr:hypothetical protein [Myxococcota bacterium]